MKEVATNIGMCKEICEYGPRCEKKIAEVGVKREVVLPLESRDAEEDKHETPQLCDDVDHHIYVYELAWKI